MFVLAIIVVLGSAYVGDAQVIERNLARDIKCHAAVQYLNKYVCSGIIYNKNTMITAAQCVDRKDPKKFKILVGSTELESMPITYNVVKYVIHPERMNLHNDIALIKTEPMNFDDQVQPIRLNRQYIHPQTECNLTGWGFDDYPSGKVISSLQNINTMTQMCNCMHTNIPIYGSNICIYYNGTPRVCVKDPGSPLMVEGNLIGIFSWGVSCSETVPAVFSRLSSYVSWINSTRFS